jgi:hypothetical protein
MHKAAKPSHALQPALREADVMRRFYSMKEWQQGTHLWQVALLPDHSVLKSEPELGRIAKILAQPQRSVCGNSPVALQNFRHTCLRNANVFR